MRRHKTMRRAAHANHGRSCVERSSGSRSNACRGPRKRRLRSGSGGTGPTPPNLSEVWQAYTARFSLEHTFRFFKQTLRWTDAQTPLTRALLTAGPGCLLLAYVHLRLARDAVTDVRLPWQPPLPAERRTPARVRRAFSHVLPQLGGPVSVPKPCGRSPGRPRGKRSPPAPRFPAVKLTP